jgi:hypothetical protein
VGLKHKDSCLEKAAPDEPIFVLRASDKLAPVVVRIWSLLAATWGTPFAKTSEARSCAQAMEDWQKQNGCKIPD